MRQTADDVCREYQEYKDLRLKFTSLIIVI